MDRRHFLGSLSALAAGMALDVDRLLWVPGRTTYFDIVAPKVHRYSRLLVRDLDGVTASITVAHDFHIDLGQSFGITHSDVGPAMLFRGTVVSIESPLNSGLVVPAPEIGSWFDGEKKGAVTEVSTITRQLSDYGHRMAVSDFPMLRV